MIMKVVPMETNEDVVEAIDGLARAIATGLSYLGNGDSYTPMALGVHGKAVLEAGENIASAIRGLTSLEGREGMVDAPVVDQRGSVGASIPELAGEWSVSEFLLRSLANQGKLPGCRRLGRRYVVDRETFTDWMKEGKGI
jgi:hypothetical protein